MLLRDYQRVPVMDRVDVHEGQRLSIFKEFETRHRAGDDLAENALGIAGHWTSSPNVRAARTACRIRTRGRLGSARYPAASSATSAPARSGIGSADATRTN